MALVVTAGVDSFRSVSVWRTEEAFRAVVDTVLGPDLAEHGLAVDRVTVEPVVSKGISGTEAQPAASRAFLTRGGTPAAPPGGSAAG